MIDTMNRVIKVLESPSEEDLKYYGYGIYKVLFEREDGTTYEGHLPVEDYKVMQIKQKLFFEMKVPYKVIEEFESAVRSAVRADDRYDED